MEKIEGYVEHIIFRNASNGYTVLNLVSEDSEIIAVGMFQSIENGESIEAEGEFTDHPSYGSQFKVERYEIKTLEDVASIRRYLGSGAIKGIGEALAERIVKKFGSDTLRIMEEEPERLAEIKGISERKAMEIGEQAESRKDLREAMMFLQKYGISNALAVKIYETYQMGMYSILRENPYRLTEDISGVGFKIADEIASKIGIHTDSDYRIRSALLYVLGQASGEGHMYLPKDVLLMRTAQMLEMEAESLAPQLDNLIIDRKLIARSQQGVDAVYGTAAYYAELNCARMLLDLNLSAAGSETDSGEVRCQKDAEEKKIRDKVEKIESTEGVELDELQREAVVQSMQNGILIITGGPGTGKTTTINTLLKYLEQEGIDFVLAAPTGRAAKRMTETTGYEARTIHRLLEINAGSMDGDQGSFFERNEENPLEAGAVIIDEMSMVDIYLFQALLKAVTVGTRLVLVGDMNQLPSVGPGKVLKELIESGVFPVAMLQKIFRQAGESDIVINAHRIHAGKAIRLDNKSKDFFFLPRNDVNVIYKHMVQLITEKLPGYVNAKPYDIQVLTPMRKGALGVEALNQILQEHINKSAPGKKEHMHGNVLFREGDKVMQIKNNYKLEWEILSRYNIPIDSGLGVFNGDTGTIKEINAYGEYFMVEYDEHKMVRYSFQQLDELELAYAVTIHKSQGSEYPAVILPLLGGPRMLMNRNLLYTAVTRAKNCVTILGDPDTIDQMIQNESEIRRYAGLKDRLSELERI